ncbi:MAG: LysM domain-containing protein [Victivallales bacterium]
MRSRSLKVVLSAAAVYAITIGALIFTSGCKSKPVEKDANLVPPPSALAPAAQPAAAAPALVAAPAANTTPIASTPAIPGAKAEVTHYTVKSGDSFSKIAKKYGVGMNALAAYNNMSIQKPLRIGVTLKIPPAKAK